ncbi:CTP synthetase [Marimonas arenosa]|uniref:CTP synthetase n=1 Tax=Marimonas arenosa TaxID=1795305 RepID=A0AAE3WC44_9RHOB|nr:CTP synthetase [Marimonas arenosa]MDQ2089994.1 CTP synthetase [Marimonas arenosa]
MFLILIVHLFLGSTLAGTAVIAALTMGWDTVQPILVAALIGWLVSLPVTVYVARLIRNL